MDAFLSFFGWINDVGASVILPIALFLIGLAFGVKPARALVNGLKVGIGFVGLNIMMGVVGQQLGPLAQMISERTGVSLPVPDVGVGLHFTVTFAPAFAALFIPAGIILNMVMLLSRLTKTVDIDVWNYWCWMFSAVMVHGLTGSLLWAAVAFIVTGALSLVLGDLQAPAIQKEYNLPGISFPHAFSTFFGLLAVPFNKLFDAIPGFRDLNADPDSLQKKIGPLGDSTIFGLVIGTILAAIAGYNFTQALQTGVMLAAILVLMPQMIGILVSGLMPLSNAARATLSKKFPGREYYIGLDCAVGVAQPVSLVVGIILIPITVLIAGILPGNRVLPLADLAFLGFWVATPMALFRKNIIRGVIFGAVGVAVSLLMATNVAPLVTKLAVGAGMTLPSGTEQVSMLTIYPWGWLCSFVASFFAR